MSQSYWDPANLLGVTFHTDDSYGEIQCVGLARSQHNNRCRWTIEDPDRAKVRPLLIQMSRMKPSIITNQTLRQLAVLCLCPDYHARQVHEVVNRWAGVVETAADHHRNVIDSAPVPAANNQANLEASLEDAREKLALARADVEQQNASAALFAARTLESTNRLRSEATTWKSQCEKLEDEKATQAITISQLQRSLRELEKGLGEARSAATGNADRVQALDTSWEEKYNKSEAGRAEIAAAVATVEEQIKSLEEQIKDLEESLRNEQASSDRLAKAHEALKMEANSLTKAHEELQMEANSLACDFEQSEEERDILKATLENSKEEHAAQLGALQHELDEATARLSASQIETAEAELTAYDLEQTLKANTEEVQSLQGELAQVAALLSTFQEKRGQQDAMIAELRESVQAGHRAEVESLQTRLSDAYAEQEQHENTIFELEGTNRYLRESNEKSLAEDNANKEELNVLRETEKELNAVLAALKSQRDEARKHLADARVEGEELDALRKKEAEADAVRLALQSERDEARKENRELRTKVENSDKNTVAADEALGKLKLELAKSEKTAATLTAEVGSRDRSLGEVQTELQRERVRVEQLEATVSELQSQRSSAGESKTRSEARAELEAKDRALRQHQSDLEHQRRRVAELEERVKNLEASEARLRGSIAACWLHGVGTAFGRKGKRAREKKAGGIAVSVAAA